MAGVDRKEENSYWKIRPTCFNDFSQGFNWLRVRNKINHTYSSNYHRDLPQPIITVAVVVVKEERGKEKSSCWLKSCRESHKRQSVSRLDLFIGGVRQGNTISVHNP